MLWVGLHKGARLKKFQNRVLILVKSIIWTQRFNTSVSLPSLESMKWNKCARTFLSNLGSSNSRIYYSQLRNHLKLGFYPMFDNHSNVSSGIVGCQLVLHVVRFLFLLNTYFTEYCASCSLICMPTTYVGASTVKYTTPLPYIG